jgi:hypothetical protein
MHACTASSLRQYPAVVCQWCRTYAHMPHGMQLWLTGMVLLHRFSIWL